MFGVHEHKHSSQQIGVHDVVLHVVRVMLHTERQQLQYQSQELGSLEIIYKRQTGCNHKTESYKATDKKKKCAAYSATAYS